jgi:integrase
MRKSEILKLKWPSVDLRQGLIEIAYQKNGERSVIRLDKTALDTLTAKRFGADLSGYVFPGTLPGKPFYDLKRQFENAANRAKLQDVTFHTLRHTTASHLVMSGVDLVTVKEIMRHKSIEMTLRSSVPLPSEISDGCP